MNFQIALKILLLSYSFTTNASAINNSMEGNNDVAASSSDALFARKLLSSEEVGNGVTRYTVLPVLNNWNEAKGFCTDQGLVLATKSQICPNGPSQPPLGGTLTGDQWVAIADGSNTWLQLGPRLTYDPTRLCKTHFEYYGSYSAWGIDNAKIGAESNYLYCAEATPEPTMFPTSVPTSKPTTFSEGIEAAVGDGCKNGIDFVTSYTTDSGVACDKVTFCNGSTSNTIFDPNVENVCIDFTKADEECTNFQVLTTFDNSWRMNALSLTSSSTTDVTDPENVKMKGSNDMSTWVELYDSQLVFTERNKPETFVLANTDMFKYYSLSFERKNASSKMHIGHYGLVEEYTKSCATQIFEGISDYSFE